MLYWGPILCQLDSKGPNWTFLYLKTKLQNALTPIKFEDSTRITPENPHDVIYFDSTSIPLINIEIIKNEPN